VEVWRREGLTRTLGDDDTLSGEEVLPGFAFPVRELWE
jgi:predicted cupin superfamily sugar epimerase